MSGVTSLSNLSNSTFTFPIEVVLLSSAYGRQGPKPLTWTNLPFFNLLQDISNNSTEYTYDKSLTPQLLALSSSMGEAGSTVSVYGANFTSKTFVQFGDISCNNATLKNSTCISCILSSGYIGFKQVSAYIPGLGFAFVDPAISTFAFTTRVLAVWPTTASLSGSTTVKISYSPIMMSGIPTVNITTGNAPCSITFLNSTYLECLTSPLSNQDTSLVYPNFLINGVSADYSNCSLAVCGFKFGASVTPSIQSLNPIRGSNATILEIDGINFGTILSDVSVFLEGALLSSNPCSTVNVTASKIFCTIWPMEAGSYSVVVILNGRGQASGYLSFEYALSVKSSGGRLVSGVGGGETITLTGDGFGQSTSITVCGFDCPITSYSQSIISCLSPSVTTLYDMTNFSSSLQNTTCAVDILDAPEFVITNYNYTYAPTLTPIISLVSPIVGGTAGGTILTITGSGFGDNSTKTTVQIGSSMCSVSFINSTTIKCTTSATNAGGDFTVVVYVAGKGNSYSPQNIIYSYTDRWSSQFTWGNSSKSRIQLR